MEKAIKFTTKNKDNRISNLAEGKNDAISDKKQFKKITKQKDLNDDVIDKGEFKSNQKTKRFKKLNKMTIGEELERVTENYLRLKFENNTIITENELIQKFPKLVREGLLSYTPDFIILKKEKNCKEIFEMIEERDGDQYGEELGCIDSIIECSANSSLKTQKLYKLELIKKNISEKSKTIINSEFYYCFSNETNPRDLLDDYEGSNNLKIRISSASTESDGGIKQTTLKLKTDLVDEIYKNNQIHKMYKIKQNVSYKVLPDRDRKLIYSTDEYVDKLAELTLRNEKKIWKENKLDLHIDKKTLTADKLYNEIYEEQFKNFNHKSRANLHFPLDLSNATTSNPFIDCIKMIENIPDDDVRLFKCRHLIKSIKTSKCIDQFNSEVENRKELRKKIQDARIRLSESKSGKTKIDKEFTKESKEIRTAFKKEWGERINGKEALALRYYPTEGYFKINFGNNQSEESLRFLSSNSFKNHDKSKIISFDKEEIRDFYEKSGVSLGKFVGLRESNRIMVMEEVERFNKKRKNNKKERCKLDENTIKDFDELIGYMAEKQNSNFSGEDKRVMMSKEEDNLGFKNEIFRKGLDKMGEFLEKIQDSRWINVLIQIKEYCKSYHFSNGNGSKHRDISFVYSNSPNVLSISLGPRMTADDSSRPIYSVIKINSKDEKIYKRIYEDSCYIIKSSEKDVSYCELNWRRIKNSTIIHCRFEVYRCLAYGYNIYNDESLTKINSTIEAMVFSSWTSLNSQTSIGLIQDSDPKMRANLINTYADKINQFKKCIMLSKNRFGIYFGQKYSKYMNKLFKRMVDIRNKDSRFFRVLKERSFQPGDKFNIEEKSKIGLPLFYQNVDICFDFVAFQNDSVLVKTGNKDSISNHHRYISNAKTLIEMDRIADNEIKGIKAKFSGMENSSIEEAFDILTEKENNMGFHYEACYHACVLKVRELKDQGVDIGLAFMQDFNKVLNDLVTNQAKNTASRDHTEMINLKLHTSICNMLKDLEKENVVVTNMTELCNKIIEFWDRVKSEEFPKLPMRVYYYNKDQRFTNREFYILGLLYRLFANIIDKLFYKICDVDSENNIREIQKNKGVNSTIKKYFKNANEEIKEMVRSRTLNEESLKLLLNTMETFKLYTFGIDCAKWSPLATLGEYQPLHRALFDSNSINKTMYDLLDFSLIVFSHKFLEYPRIVKTCKIRDDVLIKITSAESYLDALEKHHNLKFNEEDKITIITKFWQSNELKKAMFKDSKMEEDNSFMIKNYNELYDSYYYVVSWLQGQKQHASSFKHCTVGSLCRNLFMACMKKRFDSNDINGFEYEVAKKVKPFAGHHSDDKYSIVYLSEKSLKLYFCCLYVSMRMCNLRISEKKTNFGEYVFEYLSTYFRNLEAYFPNLKMILSCVDNTRPEGYVKNSIELHNRIAECLRVGVPYSTCLFLRNLINVQLKEKYPEYFDEKEKLMHMGSPARYSIPSMMAYGTRSLFLNVISDLNNDRSMRILENIIFNDEIFPNPFNFIERNMDLVSINIPIIRLDFVNNVGRLLRMSGVSKIDKVKEILEFKSKFPIYELINPNDIKKGLLKLQSDYTKPIFLQSFNFITLNDAYRKYYSVRDYKNIIVPGSIENHPISAIQYKELITKSAKIKLTDMEMKSVKNYLIPFADVSSIIAQEISKSYSVVNIDSFEHRSGKFDTVWKSMRQPLSITKFLTSENPAVVMGCKHYLEEVKQLRPKITEEEIREYKVIINYWEDKIGVEAKGNGFLILCNILQIYKNKSREYWIDYEFDNNLLGVLRSTIKQCLPDRVFMVKDKTGYMLKSGNNDYYDVINGSIEDSYEYDCRMSLKIVRSIESLFDMISETCSLSDVSIRLKSKLEHVVSEFKIKSLGILEKINKLVSQSYKLNKCIVECALILSKYGIEIDSINEINDYIYSLYKVKGKNYHRIKYRVNYKSMRDNKMDKIRLKSLFIYNNSIGWRMILNKEDIDVIESEFYRNDNDSVRESRNKLKSYLWNKKEKLEKISKELNRFKKSEEFYRNKFMEIKMLNGFHNKKKDICIKLNARGEFEVSMNSNDYVEFYDDRMELDEIEIEFRSDGPNSTTVNGQNFSSCDTSSYFIPDSDIIQIYLINNDTGSESSFPIELSSISNSFGRIKGMLRNLKDKLIYVRSEDDLKIMCDNLPFFFCFISNELYEVDFYHSKKILINGKEIIVRRMGSPIELELKKEVEYEDKNFLDELESKIKDLKKELGKTKKTKLKSLINKRIKVLDRERKSHIEKMEDDDDKKDAESMKRNEILINSGIIQTVLSKIDDDEMKSSLLRSVMRLWLSTSEYQEEYLKVQDWNIKLRDDNQWELIKNIIKVTLSKKENIFGKENIFIRDERSSLMRKEKSELKTDEIFSLDMSTFGKNEENKVKHPNVDDLNILIEVKDKEKINDVVNQEVLMDMINKRSISSSLSEEKKDIIKKIMIVKTLDEDKKEQNVINMIMEKNEEIGNETDRIKRVLDKIKSNSEEVLIVSNNGDEDYADYGNEYDEEEEF